MNLKSQRRIAAQIMKIGENRVWMDPERTDEIEFAITREEIKRFIREKVIRKISERGVSRARARVLHQKKKMGKRRGPGGRAGTRTATISRKKLWMTKIRAQRRELNDLRSKHVITPKTFRTLYVMSKSGSFRSISDLRRYMETHNLRRKR